MPSTNPRRKAKTLEKRHDVIPWPPPSESASFLQQKLPLFFAPLSFPSSKSMIGDQSSFCAIQDKNNKLLLSDSLPNGKICASFPPFPFTNNSHNTNTSASSDGELRTFYPATSSFSMSSLPLRKSSGPPPIGVFWDIENCQVPRGRSALLAVQRIRERFFNRFLEAEFICVCDIRKESPHVIQELNDAQVSVVHVSGNSKNAADDKLRQAMRRFADVYTSIMPPDSHPATILLISGDINFATDLSDLRYRKRLYIILLHNKHAPEALILCAQEHYDFHTLLMDLPPRVVRDLELEEEKNDIPLKGGHCTMDVVVSDLPLTKNVTKIKTRLKKLSDNCGGKVVSIQGQFAVLRFPNNEAALRATKRMNGEDVFGSKIRVLYSSQVEFPSPQQQHQVVPFHQHNQQQQVIGMANMRPIMQAPPPPNIAVTRRKSGGRKTYSGAEQSIHIDLSALKKEVAALLQDVPNHTLPLFKFREMFERRYRRSISSYDLYRMRDVVCISESSNSSGNSSGSGSSSSSGRNITLGQEWIHKEDDVTLFCKLHPPKRSAVDQGRTGWAEKEITPSMPIVMIDLKTLSTRVHSMLQTHNGELPLSSFLDCYEAEFGEMELAGDDIEGVPLEHLITCVQGVEIGLSETGMKRVEWSGKKHVDTHTYGLTQPQALQMHHLSCEFIDLLKTYPRCCLPFAKLIPAYHHHFGRQCRVSDYGQLSLSSLLQTLQPTIQIMGENNNRILTLSHCSQMKRFTSDVLRVLKAQMGTKKQIKIEDFPEAFYQIFPTHPFSAENYGLCYLWDLVLELVENSNLVTLVKDDEGRSMLAIPKREQTPQEIHKTRIFATEVYDLLRHSIRCEMPFSKFIPSYHHHFGRQCRISDYGFSKLAELFESIPDTVMAINPNNPHVDCNIEDKILRLTPREQLKVIGEQLWCLIEKRQAEGLSTGMDDLDELYLNEYEFLLRPDYCGAESLSDLVKNKLNQFLHVDGDRIELLDRAKIEECVVEDSKNILDNQKKHKRGSRLSPKWYTAMASASSMPPPLYSPCQSPGYTQGPSAETNVFTFDRPTPFNPPVYDMWMRDTTTTSPPPISPPMVWTCHPFIYPQPPPPPTTPGQHSNVIVPTHISVGSGPWSPPPAQLRMFEQRLPSTSMNTSASNFNGNNTAPAGRLTNAFQRLSLNCFDE